MNCYLAVGDTPGFALHWDDHDVIAVQLSSLRQGRELPLTAPAANAADQILNELV